MPSGGRREPTTAIHERLPGYSSDTRPATGQEEGSHGTPGSWVLARTRSLAEYRAAAALEHSGYVTYLPRVRTPRPRVGYGDAPLFPGYVFVRHEIDGGGLPNVDHIAGLLGWVRFDGQVPEVSDEVIAELDRRLQQMNSQGGYWARYRAGELVRVTMGASESLGEVLEEPKTPGARVRVLLTFMGGQVPAHVPWRDLKPIDEESLALFRGRPRRTRGKGRWVRGFGPRTAAGV